VHTSQCSSAVVGVLPVAWWLSHFNYDNQFFGSIAVYNMYNTASHICFVKWCCSSTICTQQLQKCQKHFSDIILKPTHAHWAVAARFCSDTSAVTVTVTKTLVLHPLLKDWGRITESIRIPVTIDSKDKESLYAARC